MLAAPVCSALTDVIDYFDTVENLKLEDGRGTSAEPLKWIHVRLFWIDIRDDDILWNWRLPQSDVFTFHPVTKTFLTCIHFLEDLSLPLSSPQGKFWLHSADWHFLCVGDMFQMFGSGSLSTRTFSLSSGLCCLPLPPLCECWDSTCHHVQEWSVLCQVSRWRPGHVTSEFNLIYYI